MLKVCKLCKVEKDILEFGKRNDSKDGYRTICKSCMKEYQKGYQKNYYIDNKDKISGKKYSYRRTDEYRKKSREFAKNNKEVIICRNVINETIKRLKISKNNIKNIELVGYTYYDFKLHMEKLFEQGMNWDNHGEWHVDHITPISKFEKGTDIKIINALSNLQPLWAKENLEKSNKIYGQ